MLIYVHDYVFLLLRTTVEDAKWHCLCVCLFAFMCICRCAGFCMCAFLCMCVHVFIYVYICMPSCACVPSQVCACVSDFLGVCIARIQPVCAQILSHSIPNLQNAILFSPFHIQMPACSQHALGIYGLTVYC